MNVAVICTGNICRSPMGEILLREAIAEHRAGLRTVLGRDLEHLHRDGAVQREVVALMRDAAKAGRA